MVKMSGASFPLMGFSCFFLFFLLIYFCCVYEYSTVAYAKTMLSNTLLRRTAASRSLLSNSRAFSTDAEHRPVISLNGLAARYANAVYVAASKAKNLDGVETELTSLQAASNDSPKFAQFLNNPLISRDAKSKAVSSLSDKFSPATVNLLTTLAGNARLSELPKIVSTYTTLMKAKRGQVDAKIISAEPLTNTMIAQVQEAMKSQMEPGKKVVLETITDPSIVGGLQVQIGDQFLDLSVKSRVEEIANMPIS